MRAQYEDPVTSQHPVLQHHFDRTCSNPANDARDDIGINHSINYHPARFSRPMPVYITPPGRHHSVSNTADAITHQWELSAFDSPPTLLADRVALQKRSFPITLSVSIHPQYLLAGMRGSEHAPTSFLG